MKVNEWETYGPEEDNYHSILFCGADGGRDNGLYIRLGQTKEWDEEGYHDSFHAYTDDIMGRTFMDLKARTLEDAKLEAVAWALKALKEEKERIDWLIKSVGDE